MTWSSKCDAKSCKHSTNSRYTVRIVGLYLGKDVQNEGAHRQRYIVSTVDALQISNILWKHKKPNCCLELFNVRIK